MCWRCYSMLHSRVPVSPLCWYLPTSIIVYRQNIGPPLLMLSASLFGFYNASRSFICGCTPRHSLSSVLDDILPESIYHLELEELQCHVLEACKADVKCQTPQHSGPESTMPTANGKKGNGLQFPSWSPHSVKSQ